MATPGELSLYQAVGDRAAFLRGINEALKNLPANANLNDYIASRNSPIDAFSGPTQLVETKPSWFDNLVQWNRDMGDKIKGYTGVQPTAVDTNTGNAMPTQYGVANAAYEQKKANEELAKRATVVDGVSPSAGLASSVADTVVDLASGTRPTTATASVKGASPTDGTVSGGYSTMTPIQFAQLAPHQVPGEATHDDRFAYRNGQTTRKYYFDNGQPVSYTNNPHFNNGTDPNYSSWSGMNIGMNTPLSVAQQTVMARMLGQNQKNMAAFRSAQAQSAIQEAMNDPRAWQATKQLLEQGVPMQEAQYAAISQVLDNNGQMGALQLVAPQYAEQAAQRQGNQGALAGMFGMDYEAQPNLYGVTSPIASIQTNGDTTAIQLGNARYNIPTNQMPQFMQQIAALPNGPQLLSTMAKNSSGLTVEQRERLREIDQQNKKELEEIRQKGREELQKKSQDFKEKQNEAKNKNTNVVGSTRF